MCTTSHPHIFKNTAVWLSYDPSVFSLSFLIGLFSLLHHPLKNTGGHAAVFSLSFLIGFFSLLHHPLKKHWRARCCGVQPELSDRLVLIFASPIKKHWRARCCGVQPELSDRLVLTFVHLLKNTGGHAAGKITLRFAADYIKSAGRWYVLAAQRSLHPVLSCCLCTARGTSFFLLCCQPVTVRRLSCARTAQLTPRSPCAPRAC